MAEWWRLLQMLLYLQLTLGASLIMKGLARRGEWLAAALCLVAWLAISAAWYFSRHPELQATGQRVANVLGPVLVLTVLGTFTWLYVPAELVGFVVGFLLVRITYGAGSLLGIGGLMGVSIGLELGGDD
jgi:hypothetical protein